MLAIVFFKLPASRLVYLVGFLLAPPDQFGLGAILSVLPGVPGLDVKPGGAGHFGL